MKTFKQANTFIRDNQIAMLQRAKELHWLYNKIRKHQVGKGTFVEIGSGHGASAYILGNAMPEGSRIIMIDKNHPDLRTKVTSQLIEDGYDVSHICGDSTDEQTPEILLMRLKGKPIDVLFIDGDHHYKAVKSDYMIYSAFVKRGGLIALHDIARHPDKTRIQVWKLWDEIKRSVKTFEYIERRHHVGVGMVIK